MVSRERVTGRVENAAKIGMATLAFIGGMPRTVMAESQASIVIPYERPADILLKEKLLHRLGTGPFAKSEAEAYANLKAGLEACMKSENLPPELLPELEAIARGPMNFYEEYVRSGSKYAVTGVAPDYMTPNEAADCMVSRDKNGNIAVVGEGESIVRMNTDRVVNTKTGQIGYPVERKAGVVSIRGKLKLVVITRPAECNNWTIKILDIPEAPPPPIVPPKKEEFCPDPKGNTEWEADEKLSAETYMRAGQRVIKRNPGGYTVYSNPYAEGNKALLQSIMADAKEDKLFEGRPFILVEVKSYDPVTCKEETKKIICIYLKGSHSTPVWYAHGSTRGIPIGPDNFERLIEKKGEQPISNLVDRGLMSVQRTSIRASGESLIEAARPRQTLPQPSEVTTRPPAVASVPSPAPAPEARVTAPMPRAPKAPRREAERAPTPQVREDEAASGATSGRKSGMRRSDSPNCEALTGTRMKPKGC